jgi:hypothetical protein
MINTAYYGELADDSQLKTQFLYECIAAESGSAG